MDARLAWTITLGMKRVRPGFLVTFTVLLVVIAGGVGYLVSTLLASDIRNEQIDAARERTELLAQSAFAPDFRKQLHGRDAAQLKPFDEAALAAARTGNVDSLAVWDTKGRIVYATDHAQIDKQYLPSPAVKKALEGQGQTVAMVQNGATSPIDKKAGKQVHVAVPLYSAKGKKPIAAWASSASPRARVGNTSRRRARYGEGERP